MGLNANASPAAFDPLKRELAAWEDAGLNATFWWRDDDAVTATPALERLLSLAEAFDAPLCLAVIPALAETALADRLDGASGDLSVAVHGWRHKNQAPGGEKKSEFPGTADPDDLAAEARQALSKLQDMFGDRTAPVFVPPWNRYSPDLPAALPNLGYQGISAFGPRSPAHQVPGLCQVNCHVDPVDWRGHRGFVGQAAAVRQIAGHLKARRNGEVDRDEATGLLSHHLMEDDGVFDFFGQVVKLSNSFEGVRWLSAGELFGRPA